MYVSKSSPLCARDRLDEPVDVLVRRVGKHDRHDRRVAVGGDELLVAGLVVRLDRFRPERRSARDESLDRAAEGRIVDREPVAADDEHLVDLVGLTRRRHSLVDEQARRLRLGRPGEVVLGGQRVAQKRHDQRARGDQRHQPETHRAPRVLRAPLPDVLSKATCASDFLPSRSCGRRPTRRREPVARQRETARAATLRGG